MKYIVLLSLMSVSLFFAGCEAVEKDEAPEPTTAPTVQESSYRSSAVVPSDAVKSSTPPQKVP
jgi:hypothetical protein